ncbi:MAG: GH3 auxin-responsive promoter family protein [Clostridiales bacterium]|nr:GH3 auxin-responsive promoter family protein [Clostridiales bacterium]
MRFQDKLIRKNRNLIWQEYCGFLELSIADYMRIQRRLMDEQMRMWCESGLGKLLLNGKTPKSIDELRSQLPLTAYSDYAGVLLTKRAEMLPAVPIVWIQTTWEGGVRPFKLAPYTRAMLDTYKHNTLSITILTSARNKGDIDVRRGDRILYGGAPLPYATGLIPALLAEDIDIVWLPDAKADALRFSERIKKGFSMAMKSRIDYFFATGSVANYISENFGKLGNGRSGKVNVSVRNALRWVRAKYYSRRDSSQIKPRDIFNIKGFVLAGTDSKCYKQRLLDAWGVTPIEIAAGTESTCIATETLDNPGMVFFPDACFYEFIPEAEMKKNLNNPNYRPRTCLMDEVEAGVSYELVISVLHGGVFMRYRIGDVYHCLSVSSSGIPRFTFVDRTPNIIDIAGFTRLTQNSIEEVIRLSKLGIQDWIARKEFDENMNPYFHMYVELSVDAQQNDVVTNKVLIDHLSAYFRAFDSDYEDLKRLLNIEPLKITVLKYGTIANYEEKIGQPLPRINTDSLEMIELLKYQSIFRTPPEEEVSEA